MDADVWCKMPTDIVGLILNDQCIPIDTRLYFKPIFGMRVSKIQVPPDLEAKLNRVMRNRNPEQFPFGPETRLYNTNGRRGIYAWPPKYKTTLIVSMIEGNISYCIYVKKDKTIAMYSHYFFNGVWRGVLSRVRR
jgi:hypothetical protein